MAKSKFKNNKSNFLFSQCSSSDFSGKIVNVTNNCNDENIGSITSRYYDNDCSKILSYTSSDCGITPTVGDNINTVYASSLTTSGAATTTAATTTANNKKYITISRDISLSNVPAGNVVLSQTNSADNINTTDVPIKFELEEVSSGSGTFYLKHNNNYLDVKNIDSALTNTFSVSFTNDENTVKAILSFYKPDNILERNISNLIASNGSSYSIQFDHIPDSGVGDSFTYMLVAPYNQFLLPSLSDKFCIVIRDSFNAINFSGGSKNGFFLFKFNKHGLPVRTSAASISAASTSAAATSAAATSAAATSAAATTTAAATSAAATTIVAATTRAATSAAATSAARTTSVPTTAAPTSVVNLGASKSTTAAAVVNNNNIIYLIILVFLFIFIYYYFLKK